MSNVPNHIPDEIHKDYHLSIACCVTSAQYSLIQPDEKQ